MIDIPAIERATRSVTIGSPLREDAVQEAVIAVWRALEADPELPENFARVIARNRARDVLRGRSHFGAPERTPGSGHQAEWVDMAALTALDAHPIWEPIRQAEERRLLESTLDVLDPDERGIVLLMLEGYQHAEIAERFERSVGWVRARMPRIRQKLLPHYESWLRS